MSKDEIIIALFGDGHGGGPEGLVMPGTKLENSSVVKLSPFQEQLWSCYEVAVEELNTLRPDTVVWNGDIVDGANRGGYGEDTHIADPGIQAAMMADVVPMVRAKHYEFRRGTAYHAGHAPNMDKEVERLVAKAGDGKYTTNFTTSGFIKVFNWRIHVRHHLPFAKKIRTTPLYNDILDAFQEEHFWGKCDIVVRSHVHSYTLVETNRCTGLTLPCWQGMTQHVHTKGGTFKPPDIGYVIIRLTSESFTIQKRLFPIEAKMFMSDVDRTPK